jgi:hypothetical protein
MTDITAANSVFTLSVPAVFAVNPVALQGYSTDDAFSTPEVDTAETFLGVDGKFSAGLVPYLVKQNIVFQADSPSITLFETWLAAMAAANYTPYFGTATILLPALAKQYVLGPGLLSRITPIPQAKKVLQPVTYEITWAGPVQAQPLG